MLGYDISWAAFNVVEVMSAPKFTFKGPTQEQFETLPAAYLRIGYLAASQCFHEGTDVIMLTTNQIRKDLSSPSQYDTGVALTGLSCFVTPDLARDLANDIMTLMSHTKPYIRKKAVLIMYKVFLKYPESLRPAFPRLKEKLEDPDPGVQSAAVNVICELARRNPKNYLSLAPLFFKLMTSSTNNWVLIKIIKLASDLLFGALTPLEPRLGKKLIEPLTNLIHSTSAMSLLYECVNTVIAVLISLSSGMPNHSASIQLCVQKLRILIEDSDQNLKYLGLLAMSKILRTHPKSVQAHKDLVLQCLDDKDEYISILVELTRLEGTRHGHLIAAQMLDVAIRVKAIRRFAVSQMSALLDSAHLVASSTQRNGICEVLYAAAWICGEFSEHLQEPQRTLEAMLRPRVTTLPGHIQAVYVQNVVKLYAAILQQKEQAGDSQAAQEATQLLVERLPQFVQSADLEVQERASCILQLVKHVQKLQAKDMPVAEEVSALFAGELNPVAPKAQKKVPVPEGIQVQAHRPEPPCDLTVSCSLDLDAWINEPLSDSESEDEAPKAIFHDEEQRPAKQRPPEADEQELARRREARKQEQANNPFYIKSSPSPQKRYQDTPGVDHIPVVQIDLSVPLKYVKLEEERRHQQRLEKDRKRKKKRERERRGTRRHSSLHTESDEDIAPAQRVDIVTEEMPENALPSDEDDKDPNDPYKALDIDLDNPLADSEKLPVQKHRNAETSKSPEKEDVPIVEKKSKKPKKKEKKHKEKERGRGKKEAAGKGEDLDFWLSTTPPAAAPAPEEPGVKASVTAPEEEREEPQGEEQAADEGEQDPEKKPSKHKKKKHKKDKEERPKDKKKSRKKASREGAAEPVENGALDEEPLPPMSSYCLLAENSYIKMTYDVQGSLQEDSRVTVSMVLENQSSSFLKSMELNVLDSLNARLARPEGSSVHDGVPVPFQLPPGISNEAQFVFTIQSIVMAQKLKGTLSFIAKNDEGSTHEKLDFKLHFPCTSYLITTPCYSDAFAKLLESGDLSMSSIKVDGISMSFQNLLAKICFHHHFSVVERVDSCASMYSRSIQGHHVCLLVKKGEKSVSVDGKCNDATLLSNLLEEMKGTLAQC
ncbi:AP-3 complex subunit delta-1-like protein [Camelus ferus]|nr:AP-3 complex subunit delta-1-like protein [Camelus ferus]